MENSKSYSYPNRIICLTEESVEILYALGAEDKIVGISNYVKRPLEAPQNHPKVSMFIKSNYKKINELKPDLVLGHSDIQKDIARDLIEMGHNVFIANHRSIDEIFQYIRFMGNLVGEGHKAQELIDALLQNITIAKKFRDELKRRPRIYFEEWDDPLISGIRWVSELIELVGGLDIGRDRSHGILAKERFTTHQEIIDANPDIIIGCWCGKKVKVESIKSRSGYENINAVKNDQVFEVEPEIFLQPGIAPLKDGINIMMNIIKNWENHYA